MLSVNAIKTLFVKVSVTNSASWVTELNIPAQCFYYTNMSFVAALLQCKTTTLKGIKPVFIRQANVKETSVTMKYGLTDK